MTRSSASGPAARCATDRLLRPRHPSGDEDRFKAYTELRDLLAAEGVPAGRIRFIHEARNGRETARLFEACRIGEVSVIVGSTESMGRVPTSRHRRSPCTPRLSVAAGSATDGSCEGATRTPRSRSSATSSYAGTFSGVVMKGGGLMT
jgi:hypothetical protein